MIKYNLVIKQNKTQIILMDMTINNTIILLNLMTGIDKKELRALLKNDKKIFVNGATIIEIEQMI